MARAQIHVRKEELRSICWVDHMRGDTPAVNLIRVILNPDFSREIRNLKGGQRQEYSQCFLCFPGSYDLLMSL